MEYWIQSSSNHDLDSTQPLWSLSSGLSIVVEFTFVIRPLLQYQTMHIFSMCILYYIIYVRCLGAQVVYLYVESILFTKCKSLIIIDI